MLNSIKNNSPSSHGRNLEILKGCIWGTLCEFTHGGSLPIMTNIMSDRSYQKYKHEIASDFLDQSAILSILTCFELISPEDDLTIAKNLEAVFKDIYKDD